MIIPSESVATDMILSKEQLKTIIYKNFLVDETFQKEILVEDYLSVDDYLMKNGGISKINSEISKINRRSNIPPKHPKPLSPTVKIVKLKQKFDTETSTINCAKSTSFSSTSSHSNYLKLGDSA